MLIQSIKIAQKQGLDNKSHFFVNIKVNPWVIKISHTLFDTINN